jgi:hypothetical protein
MKLGDCGVGSSDDGGCGNSRGKDNGNGGNGVGDDCPSHPSPLPTSSPAMLLPTPSPVLLPSQLHLSACN